MTGHIALPLGICWALVVALLVSAHHPPPRRPRPARSSFAALAGDPRGPARRAAIDATGQGIVATATALGAGLRRVARRPADPPRDRVLGFAVIAAALLVPLAPPLSPVPVACAVAVPAVSTRRAARAHQAAVTDQLPDVVDLLLLTTSAGLPVSGALSAIGARPGGPLGTGLASAAEHVSRGATTGEALGRLTDAGGPAARPLLDALIEHDRYGTPLRPALERVGIEARLRRRRHADEAARRLPVTLLFPLVLTTLPAFVLLAIVPLVAGSLGSLSP